MSSETGTATSGMGEEVSSVASRFYAASALFNGATEVVTIVLATGPAPSTQDVREWQERHTVLQLIPGLNRMGILTLYPPKDSGLLEEHSEQNFVCGQHARLYERKPILDIINLGLNEPLGRHLWRLSLVWLPEQDSPKESGSATWALVWRRNHLISDAYTTDVLLADLINNTSATVDRTSRTWSPAAAVPHTVVSNTVGSTALTLIRQVDWSDHAQAVLTKLKQAHGISSSAAIGAALASCSLFPRTGGLHVAYSRRKSHDAIPGCRIGVLSVPLTEISGNMSAMVQTAEALDARFRAIARSPKRDVTEKWEFSLRAAELSCRAAFGPCVTNSGTYSRLSVIAGVLAVSTAVDRKQGNYTVVAHIHHFKGAIDVTLAASSEVVTELQLNMIAVSLQDTFANLQVGEE